MFEDKPSCKNFYFSYNGVMTTEPIAEIAEKVLVKLRDSLKSQNSSDGFVEICAEDFDITSSTLFARELQKMHKKRRG